MQQTESIESRVWYHIQQVIKQKEEYKHVDSIMSDVMNYLVEENYALNKISDTELKEIVKNLI